MVLYKVLEEDGSARLGVGKWPLPTEDAPGEWLEVAGPLVPCENGLHLCRPFDLVMWLGPAIFEAEYEGEIVEVSDKVVVRRARLLGRIEAWNEKTARLFAADCAERVLPIFEAAHPADNRPRNAIEAARAFARGEIDAAADAAARAAAWAAAWNAARDAARDAARAAAWAAAWNAARAAARDAARDAAWDAAWDAARAAARDAARDAAWDAARAAAWAAAWDAARNAARNAARARAWDAAREWQTSRLLHYLEGGE